MLSAIGDQLYMLAAMWIAVDRFGSKAAYVAAAIGIAKIIFGMFGGLVADRWDRRWVMIVSDIVRFAAVAPLPIIASYGQIEFWQLVTAGALIGAFGAFFDPALQSCLPSITKSRNILEAMTGLMDLTQRLARAVGPGLTCVLVAMMPLSQFFTIQALSFLISAGTIFILGARLKWHSEQHITVPITDFRDLFRDIVEGFSYVVRWPAMAYCLANLLVVCGLWGIAFTVGMPILVKHSFGDNVANYGFLVGVYGVGSVMGNMLCANLSVRSSWFNVFAGDAICGLGFVAIALTHSLHWAAAAAMGAAIGGAAADVLLLNLIMAEVPPKLLGKTLSLRITVFAGGHAAGLIFAAPLFKAFPPEAVIWWCGALTFLGSAIGILRFGLTKDADVGSQSRDTLRTADGARGEASIGEQCT